MSALLLGTVGLLLAGCGDDHKNQPTQMPNPASVFCEAQGGKLDLNAGTCVLPDGTRVDEWEYYRTRTSGQTGLANPAAVFCEDQGGTVSGPEPMCRLPNGTEVDAWEYFRKNAP